MCNKIEELEKKIADLERTNDLLRTLVKKKDARIQELHEDYDELNDISIELTQDCDELKKENMELKKANDILTGECNKALMLNDKHGGMAKNLKEACNGYVKENLELYKAKEKLENECAKLKENNDILASDLEKIRYMYNELESECKDLKRELDVTKELSYERGEIVEAHQDLKDALKTILNFIYGVDTDGDKMRSLEKENESLRQTNIDLVNRFGGDTDCIIRSIMVNGGKI